MPPRQGLDWERDGADWPLRQYSRFVQTARLRWHVQYASHADAQAPTVLLLHGTGASTHSWRDVFPLLAAQCSVLALDFPGHAFTATPAPSQVATLEEKAELTRTFSSIDKDGKMTRGVLPRLQSHVSS